MKRSVVIAIVAFTLVARTASPALAEIEVCAGAVLSACFHSVPAASMWLRAWERGDIFPNLSAFCTKFAECFAQGGVFLVGYFPPKLGGILSIPSGRLGKAVVFLYGRAMRLLSYNDRTDRALEREALQMIGLAFAKHDIIPSHERAYLIFAESPRPISG